MHQARKGVPYASRRALHALLSMRRFIYSLHHVLTLRSGPQDRVSKDAKGAHR
jgi:hypothetical protein